MTQKTMLTTYYNARHVLFYMHTLLFSQKPRKGTGNISLQMRRISKQA